MKDYVGIKTKDKMTCDEVFEIIKGGSYPCGTPEITGRGITRGIRFPPGSIYTVQVGVSGKTVSVAPIYSGVKGAAKEAGLDILTGGWGSIFNRKAGKTSDDIQAVAAEVDRLLAAAGKKA